MRGTVYFNCRTLGVRNRRVVIEWQGILSTLIAFLVWLVVAIGGVHFVLLPRYYAGALHPSLLVGWLLVCSDVLVRLLLAITGDPGIVTNENSKLHMNGRDFGICVVWQNDEAATDSRNSAEFCSKCNIQRPARSHHCSKCGFCILKMDHHCPWINNCVGANNHKQFVRLLRHVLAMCLCGTFFLLLEFFYFEPLEASAELSVSFIRDKLLLVYVVLDVIAVLLMSAFLLQQYLNIRQDKTTIEKKIEFWSRKAARLQAEAAAAAEAKQTHVD